MVDFGTAPLKLKSESENKKYQLLNFEKNCLGTTGSEPKPRKIDFLCRNIHWFNVTRSLI